MFGRILMLSAVLVVTMGCGGNGFLLATVPPPVELLPGGEAGGDLGKRLISLPSAGTWRGEVHRESIRLTYDPSASGSNQWAVSEIVENDTVSRGAARIDSQGNIRINLDDHKTPLLTGTLAVREGETTATLFTANRFRIETPFLLEEGSPAVLFLNPQLALEKIDGTQYRITRYRFELRP